MDAATITPAAKPVNVFCNCGNNFSLIRKTHEEPRIVPKNGNIIPKASPFINRLLIDIVNIVSLHKLLSIYLKNIL